MTSKKSRYRIAPFDIQASASFAHQVLAKAGVAGAVIGTVNTWSHLTSDEQLQTKDLDLAVREEDTVWIEKALREMGVSYAQLDIGGVKVELPAQAVHVDFVNRRTDAQLVALFREALRAAQESADTIEIGQVEMPAVPIEYVIAMKLATARPKDDLIIQALLHQADVSLDKALAVVSRHFGIVGTNRLKALAGSPAR